MSDNEILISDLLSKFEEEAGIAEPEKNKIESSYIEESDAFSTSDIDVISKSVTVPNTEDINYNISPDYTTTYLPPVTGLPINNISPYIAQPVINLMDITSICIGKCVWIQKFQLYTYIYSDISRIPYLCTINMQTGQPEPIAMIKFENSEYVVYQDGCRRGIIAGSPYEQVWRFISDNMQIAQQPNHNT